LGRGVLTAGEHATSAQLPPGRRSGAPSPPPPPRLRVPAATPVDLLRPSTVRAFNELWYRRAPRRRLGALEPLPSFFHPLDSLADWNLLYGRRGLVQYQFVVPLAEGEVVQRAVKAIAASRLPSVLAVLKRFGPADPGPLSFPREGWTLALDFPVGPPGLPALLDRLDDLVAGAGGRVYLAKDARLDPAHVEAMYPRLGELAAVRHRVDPDGRLQSDLSRRLGLDRVAGLRAPAGRGIRAAAPGQSHG
ncbi:MAG TPA: D-arabinono-1,4-lactone oxidase, partial [Acidimicrobiales bacterium]|nr:D-arabinono-1,4-lactone oxidase [Acidimicrobiales bacterium]